MSREIYNRTRAVASTVARHEACPDAATKHSLCPSGYVAWHEWAERMAATHEQERCPTCDFWCVWVPKRGTPPASVAPHETSPR